MGVDTEQGAQSRLRLFFETVWGDAQGYVCIASRINIDDNPLGNKSLVEKFFHYPTELTQLVQYTDSLIMKAHLWYCPQVFRSKQRTKAEALTASCLWSDLDTCDPSNLLCKPTLTIQSSPGRWQAIWKINEPTSLQVLEQYSKRIAYAHAAQGSDKSGWDITQLLRVPFSLNYKYDELPIVAVTEVGPTYNNLNPFTELYPEVEKEKELTLRPKPTTVPDFADLLAEHKDKIHPAAFVLLTRQPKADWSKALWNLEVLLCEGGLEPEIVYGLCSGAACNKYDRDQRSDFTLWYDVLRAAEYVQNKHNPDVEVKEFNRLLTDGEREQIAEHYTLVEEYLELGEIMTDASPEYHQAGIFMILSALLSGHLQLETGFGTIMPNLWFLILADTTLTRKTTSMDIAMEVLDELDDDVLLATDGSVEGMLTGLGQRPGRASIFLRDEFSGLLDNMAKKDYYSGMLEAFAKLYDGKSQKRMLRKETISIKKPVFLIYAGGIRTRIQELLTAHHVESGFLPRFCIINGNVNLTRIRPLGPKTITTGQARAKMVRKLQALKDKYCTMQMQKVGPVTITTPAVHNVEMTEEAWARFQVFEASMNQDAVQAYNNEYLVPMFARLTISTLKVAMLLAALRLDDVITVELVDILHAIRYVEQWRLDTQELASKIGHTAFERQAERLVGYLAGNGGKAPRSEIMRALKLPARQAEELIITLEQRDMLIRTKTGSGELLQMKKGKISVKFNPE